MDDCNKYASSFCCSVRCHLFYLRQLPFLGDNLKFKRIILVWLLARILGLKFFFFFHCAIFYLTLEIYKGNCNNC